MKYRDLMGLPKPKKIVTKKTSKPKVNKILENVKTEFGYTDINEGPSYEYANYIKKIEKAEMQHGKAVDNLVKLLKKKGLNKEATQLDSNYKINVKRDFMKFLDFLYGKLT